MVHGKELWYLRVKQSCMLLGYPLSHKKTLHVFVCKALFWLTTSGPLSLTQCGPHVLTWCHEVRCTVNLPVLPSFWDTSLAASISSANLCMTECLWSYKKCSYSKESKALLSRFWLCSSDRCCSTQRENIRESSSCIIARAALYKRRR